MAAAEKNDPSTLPNGNQSHIMQEFVNVAGIPTSVVKLGHFSNQSNAKKESRTLMLIITGNPGNPNIYEDFMRELYDHSHGEIPVWTIGQAGHVKPPGQSLSVKDVCFVDEKKFGLEGQIKHKLCFIEEHVPSDVKLVLIGHSIGCYMILNMLEALPKEKVLKSFMLMPTLERMALSPNGLKMTPVFRYFRWILVLCAFFLMIIPKRFRSKIVDWVYRDVTCPECVHRSVLAIMTPWTINYSTFLGKIEMNQVTDLQKDLIEKHADKLCLYYGSIDKWAPVQYYNDLKTEFPYVNARLCRLNLKHAFVMESKEGQAMAAIVWHWFESLRGNILSKSPEESNGHAS